MGIFRRDRVVRASFGESVSAGSPVGVEALVRGRVRWQEQVGELILSVPEASGALSLVASSGRRVGFVVSGLRQEVVDEALRGFDVGRAGSLLWSVGEFFAEKRVVDGVVVWDVLSPLEVREGSGRRLEKRVVSGDWVSAGDTFRVFRGGLFDRFAAWSPFMGAVDVLEAMKVHQLADTAVGTSRLAGAGILWWPTDLPNMELVDGVPAEGSQQELSAVLQRAMVESITNRNSRNAVVPVIAFADSESQATPKHVLLERSDDANAFSDRMNGYALRLARAIDLPIEAVVGMGGANHWTAWVIKEDQWRFYLQPIFDIIAEALLEQFLKPMARELGLSDEAVARITLTADGTELVSKPDKSDKAIRLAQLGGFMSREAVLRESGFDPERDVSGLPEGAVNKGPRLAELPVDYRSTSPL